MMNRDGPLEGSRFDPPRIVRSLGSAQKNVVLSLSVKWGKASDHQCAKRMWYGIRGIGGKRLDGFAYLIEHKHRTDNCWRLNDLGEAVREMLVSATEEVA